MRRCGKPIGIGILCLGLFIVLSIVLPSTFIWFLIGAGLIVGGVKLLKWI